MLRNPFNYFLAATFCFLICTFFYVPKTFEKDKPYFHSSVIAQPLLAINYSDKERHVYDLCKPKPDSRTLLTSIKSRNEQSKKKILIIN